MTEFKQQLLQQKDNLKNENIKIPILYLKDVVKKIEKEPHKKFIIAMRGPQGSGKDFTAFTLIKEMGWDADQVISTDEFSYLNENELTEFYNILHKMGDKSDIIEQKENYTNLTKEEKEKIYNFRKDIFPELLKRMSNIDNYKWTEEKRDWAQGYMRTFAKIYLEHDKSPIPNVMHVDPYSLKPLLFISKNFNAEFITLVADKYQERKRNGKNELVQIHDGTQWFTENFKNDNTHGVPPEKVKKFGESFRWKLTKEDIEKSENPYK